MDEFCNNTEFWDIQETWNSTWPQFTECFQNTVLVWIASGWLWLTAPFYLYYLATSNTETLPASWKFRFKLLLTVLQFGICVAEMVVAINDLEPQGQYFRAYLVGPTIEAGTLVLASIYVILERRKRFVTSGVLFIYWTLALVTYIIPFYSKIIKKEYNDNLQAFVLFFVYFGFALIQWFIHCFAEAIPGADLRICPETTSSFLSRITFWWMTKLMIIGYKKPLTEADMFYLNIRDQSGTVIPRFECNWRNEALRLQIEDLKCSSKKVHVMPPRQGSLYLQDEDDNEVSPLLPGKSKPQQSKPAPKKPSLLKVLFKTFGFELLQAHLFKLFYDVFVFIQPLLLQLLIKFTENKYQGDFQETWKGYLLAACFFVVVLNQSFMFHQLFYRSNTLGLRIRASLISAVYKKAMLMTSKARKESTVGEIVNYMSVDTEHIQELVAYLWALWSSPLQIIMSLYFLYNTVGAAMFAGLACLIIMMPLNAFIMYMMQQLQEKQMKKKDDRIKLLNEVLNGIKILKLYAWEMAFKDKISAIRNLELHILWKSAMCGCVFTFTWTVAPYLVSLVTFATYVYSNKSHFLDAQTAFVAISLFNILRFAINLAPMIITEVVKANVSLKRLSKFLNHDDLDFNSVTNDKQEADAVVIRDGDFLWEEELGNCLSSINLRIPEGSLVAVVGQVGSGKSSLMSAILGEMFKVKGSVNVKGSVAYVPQQSWIQNATLQDNILFGRSMRRSKYNEIVEACALTADLEMLPAKDKTEIGEKGINLSGGQKQRVSVARAVYYDSDVYLLDDPLSAVDSHVGKHIFDKVISKNGLLKHKTRILVTHGVQWLPMVDTIIVMSNGRVSEMGSYEELLDHAGAFATFLQTYLVENEDEDDDPEVSQVKSKILQRLTSITSDDDSKGSGSETEAVKKILQRQLSKPKVDDDKIKKPAKEEDATAAAVMDESKLIEEEQTSVGTVKFAVFMTYAKSVGLGYALLAFLIYAGYVATNMFSNIWLSDWTADKTLNNRSLPPDSSVYRERNDYFLGIYGGVGGAQVIFITVFSLLIVTRTINAAKRLHEGLLHTILRSPMSFFDTTPTGRIINRFSQDTDIIDAELPMTFQMFVDCLFIVVSTLIIISYSTPFFMVIILPLGVLYFLIQRFYIATSRQLKRMDSKTRSPIYNHFGETLNGVSVIRAFGEQERFLHESELRVDENQQFSFASFTSNRWLGFRLELVGNFIILAASLFAVIARDTDTGISGSIVGLSVSYALQITENLNWFVRMTSDLETKVVSVERVKEYTDLPHEKKLIYSSHRPPHNWPSVGMVEFSNYSVRYRPGLDLVLKDIDAKIQSGEKIGIVGRTGAGKSSLTLGLFRLIEPASGAIIIDDENLCHMGLHDCRSRLTILPQDPVLFSGTLRMNLDPLEQYDDLKIWQALEHAHLKDYVQGLPTKLSYDCGEGGQNLSVGQKQLLCLARSLLRKTKILILDEATAAVDMETDDLIQQTIRTEFKDCTVLTIAHRINTILDYDRIIVLDKGQIQEFDSPDNLLQRTGSIFYSLAKDAGIKRQES